MSDVGPDVPGNDAKQKANTKILNLTTSITVTNKAEILVELILNLLNALYEG